MASYEIGYGKPPSETKFKPGQSGNLKGRPKLEPSEMPAIIIDAIDEPIEYREGGQIKKAPGRELNLRMLVKRAAEGDIDAISDVLSELMDAERTGSPEVEHFEFRDWLPDYDGQSADQKTKDSAARIAATPPAGWQAAPLPDKV